MLFRKGSYFLTSERKRDKRDVGKDPTIKTRRIKSHLQNGTFQNMTERFQFIVKYERPGVVDFKTPYL